MSTQVVTHEIPEETPVVTVKPYKSLFENAACLSVARKWPPMTKALPKDYLKVDKADLTKLHASKDLYNSIHLKKLLNLETALDNTLKRYASAPFPLKPGVYIMGLDLYHELEAVLSAHLSNREIYIDKFVEQYDNEVAKARDFQGAAHNPADYATANQVKAMFQFRWDWLTMDVAGGLSKVGKDALARQQQKMEEVWQDAREMTRKIMRAQYAQMVNHLIDRLTPDSDGKKKVFRNTVFNPLNEFIRTFNPRDLTEDSQLRELVSKGNQLINGVNPADLRTNDTLKDSIQQGFTEIKSILDTMVVEAADRQIELDDDEEIVQ